MVNSIERFEEFRFQALQEWSEKSRVKGIVVLIEKIGLLFLAAEKGKLSPIFFAKTAAYQKLVVRVNETVISPGWDSEEECFQRPEAAALPCLVRSVDNVQPWTLRRKIE
jgi:hypothetical protein